MAKAKKLWQVIDESLAKAKTKGYTVTRVFGIIKKYQKLANLESADLKTTIKSLNGYLDKHNIICFVTRKGVYFTDKGKYTPAQSVTDIEL